MEKVGLSFDHRLLTTSEFVCSWLAEDSIDLEQILMKCCDFDFEKERVKIMLIKRTISFLSLKNYIINELNNAADIWPIFIFTGKNYGNFAEECGNCSINAHSVERYLLDSFFECQDLAKSSGTAVYYNDSKLKYFIPLQRHDEEDFMEIDKADLLPPIWSYDQRLFNGKLVVEDDCVSKLRIRKINIELGKIAIFECKESIEEVIKSKISEEDVIQKIREEMFNDASFPMGLSKRIKRIWKNILLSIFSELYKANSVVPASKIGDIVGTSSPTILKCISYINNVVRRHETDNLIKVYNGRGSRLTEFGKKFVNQFINMKDSSLSSYIISKSIPLPLEKEYEKKVGEELKFTWKDVISRNGMPDAGKLRKMMRDLYGIKIPNKLRSTNWRPIWRFMVEEKRLPEDRILAQIRNASEERRETSNKILDSMKRDLERSIIEVGETSETPFREVIEKKSLMIRNRILDMFEKGMIFSSGEIIFKERIDKDNSIRAILRFEKKKNVVEYDKDLEESSKVNLESDLCVKCPDYDSCLKNGPQCPLPNYEKLVKK